MKKTAVLAVLLALTACNGANPDAEKKLEGAWAAKADAKKLFTFKHNGDASYVYDPASSPSGELALYWRVEGEALILSAERRGSGPNCSFKVDDQNLTLHNGKDQSCMGGDPINMEVEFQRVQQ